MSQENKLFATLVLILTWIAFFIVCIHRDMTVEIKTGALVGLLACSAGIYFLLKEKNQKNQRNNDDDDSDIIMYL